MRQHLDYLLWFIQCVMVNVAPIFRHRRSLRPQTDKAFWE